MPNVKLLAKSFNGGELTPEFFGQLDDAKYQTGLATARNVIIYPHGPAANRTGTFFVREVKDSTKKTRVINFSYSTTQTFALEIGAGYFRFHTLAATLLQGAPAAYNNATAYIPGGLVSSGGVNYYCIANTTGNAPPNATYWYVEPAEGSYEVPNPYAEADLFDIHFVQSQDVLTFVHPGYKPMELRRLGATNWTLTEVTFASSLLVPTTVAAAATVAAGAGLAAMNYKVTSVGANGLEESLASANATCNNNLLTTGNYNTITWDAMAGTTRYNVYKQSNGLYGFIGQTDGVTFKDDNITADVSKTPPISYAPFGSASNEPGAVSYFDQRRVFAGTLNSPQNFWMTRPGTESNLSYSIPSRDDDAISVRIAAREANTIRHLVPLTNLILLTSSAEWQIVTLNSDALTPSSIAVRPQSYFGASNVQPVVVGNQLIYVAARGGHMREMAYAWQSSGYISGDMSLRAPHLFDGYDIKDISYSKAPYPIIWATSTSGSLIGVTYVPEQQVGAMHHHDTFQGVFESVTTVAEGAEDINYYVIQRTMPDMSVKRFIECSAPRKVATRADNFYVDCGLTYSGAPATVISGYNHLEGFTVNILADGAVVASQTVIGGAITLATAARKVQVGLPITSDIVLLPLAMEGAQANGQGRQKNVNKVWLGLIASGGLMAGPSFDHLTNVLLRSTNDNLGSPSSLFTGTESVDVDPSWGDDGQVHIRQTDPLPFTLRSMALEVAVGG